MSKYELVLYLSTPGTLPVFLVGLLRTVFPRYDDALFKVACVGLAYFLLWVIGATAYAAWWVSQHLCY